MSKKDAKAPAERAEGEQDWYKDAIIYQVHVKSFADGSGDGIGDFAGLAGKLDYLKTLGVTAIWLLPFYPSPLRDDGYDISDYMSVNPSYGTMAQLRKLIKEAHKRGIRVITELVLNHTSDEHEWFRKAKAGERRMKGFYVWSRTPDRYEDARVIFKDFESSNWAWSKEVGEYYWHRFYSHQPDLNYDNPAVQRAMIKVVDFWLGLGVDGLRLDAVPYLFQREGTSCENLPETHEFLKRLRRHTDSRFRGRMLLAEANQWPGDAVDYFGNGDECHMAFHFPLMPRMFMAVQLEDRFPITDIFEQTPGIPDSSQWAIFLRNHDELTLEMVTDEERDYMYNIYAKDSRARINLGIRRRLAPLLDNDRRKIELMNVLLFTLPGTPVIYYGDEIGMGDNYYLGDRDGVRTPMQWSADTNAGFSRANPQRLYLPVIIDPEYHYSTVNVENQLKNHSSLLWWMKRMISIRKHFRAFGRGRIRFLYPENSKIFSFIREHDGERILVAVNLSRQHQAAELDLSGYRGYVPEDVFGGTTFPEVRDAPYVLSFSPYGYYVFTLGDGEKARMRERKVMELRATSTRNLFRGRGREELEERVLPGYLVTSGWFDPGVRHIEEVVVRDVVPLDNGFERVMLIIKVHFKDSRSESYCLPVAVSYMDEGEDAQEPPSIIARVAVGKERGHMYDGIHSPALRAGLLEMALRSRSARGGSGRLRGESRKRRSPAAPPSSVASEGRNAVIQYGDRYALKLFRKVERGTHPEWEVLESLGRNGFGNAPSFLGGIRYHSGSRPPFVIATVSEWLQVQQDAFSLFSDEAERFMERVLSQREHLGQPHKPGGILAGLSSGSSRRASELIGEGFLESVRMLARRAAGFHLAISGLEGRRGLPTEPITQLYQSSLHQSFSSIAKRIMEMAQRAGKGGDNVAGDVTALRPGILKSFGRMRGRRLGGMKIRVHGCLTLEEFLFTGKDFMMVDFEGRPDLHLTTRRLLRSPLSDVATLLRSIHRSSRETLARGRIFEEEDLPYLEGWADFWYKECSRTFLREYAKAVDGTGLLPPGKEERRDLLLSLLMVKALREMERGLKERRPELMAVATHALKELVRESA